MYESFARVYDTFMDDVPYEKWARFLTGYLKKNRIEEGLVLDLGCGTGKMTRLLAEAGYDMIGVDISGDMLQMAREREVRSGQGILYLQQDMREFELYGTVRAVVSCCDCLNYILSEEELLRVFSLVNNYLDPGGLFLFDMNTPYKYRSLLGSRTFAESREDGAFIWENTWYEEEQINEYDMTLFIREGEDGAYRRFYEEHFQRAYAPRRVTELLSEAGLLPVETLNAYTGRMPGKRSGRLLFSARECTKKEQMFTEG